MESIAVAYEEDQYEFAQELAKELHLPIDNRAKNQLLVTKQGLLLKISPFLPFKADFSNAAWKKRHDEGKKQGLIRACKPMKGMRIIDATAGWGRDSALLASFGAQVLMIERNPIMKVLLQDALRLSTLNLSVVHQDAKIFLQALQPKDFPDLIYIDPMHPIREKSALVKKDLQILQQLIGWDKDALELLEIARTRVLKKVVVKWPQQCQALLPPTGSIRGKTIRFDIFQAV